MLGVIMSGHVTHISSHLFFSFFFPFSPPLLPHIASLPFVPFLSFVSFPVCTLSGPHATCTQRVKHEQLHARMQLFLFEVWTWMRPTPADSWSAWTRSPLRSMALCRATMWCQRDVLDTCSTTFQSCIPLVVSLSLSLLYLVRHTQFVSTDLSVEFGGHAFCMKSENPVERGYSFSTCARASVLSHWLVSD